MSIFHYPNLGTLSLTSLQNGAHPSGSPLGNTAACQNGSYTPSAYTSTETVEQKARFIFDSISFNQDYKDIKNKLLQRASQLQKPLFFSKREVLRDFLLTIAAALVTVGIVAIILMNSWLPVILLVVGLMFFAAAYDVLAGAKRAQALQASADKIVAYNDFETWKRLRVEAQGMSLEELTRAHSLPRVYQYALLDPDAIMQKIREAEIPQLSRIEIYRS